MIEASSKLFNNNLDYKTQIQKIKMIKLKTKFYQKIQLKLINTLSYENTLNIATKGSINGFLKGR